MLVSGLCAAGRYPVRRLKDEERPITWFKCISEFLRTEPGFRPVVFDDEHFVATLSPNMVEHAVQETF